VTGTLFFRPFASSAARAFQQTLAMHKDSDQAEHAPKACMELFCRKLYLPKIFAVIDPAIDG
jgi:hypothetical protein